MMTIIFGGVAGAQTLIKFTCDMKLWDIAITLDDSSDIYKALDGSAVFRKMLRPLVGTCRAPASPGSSWSPQLSRGHWQELFISWFLVYRYRAQHESEAKTHHGSVCERVQGFLFCLVFIHFTFLPGHSEWWPSVLCPRRRTPL